MEKRVKIRAFRAEQFVLRLRVEERTFRVARLFFMKDGSIAVAFPYYPRSHGLVGIGCLKPGTDPVNLDLTEDAQVTSHLVKYSHHRSGEALFSQSGRIYSRVRKASVPLSSPAGHLFTFHIQGVTSYEEDTTGRDDTEWAVGDGGVKERTLTFNLRKKQGEFAKFVVWCCSRQQLKGMLGTRVAGPVTNLRRDEGDKPGIMLSAPVGHVGSSTFLIFTADAIPLSGETSTPHLLLLGGFDPPEVARDAKRETRFLVMSYPAESPADLIARLGSIDYESTLDREPKGKG